MAKKPQDSMDEEEIIRRRDGVAGPVSDEPFDADAKRALADARLRALAFALGTEHGVRARADETDDSELLAYLLDTLPEQRRMALEQALRGNPAAFGRLMTLRAAFSSGTDSRDQQRAYDPARKISRHTAGWIDIRRNGEILEFFKDATQPQPSFDAPLASPALAFELRAYRASRPPASKDPRLEWLKLRNSFEWARPDFDAGIRLINESQSLLERWWDIIDREEAEARESGAPVDHREAEELRERLSELLRELKTIANRINDELSDVASATAGTLFPPSQITALSVDALLAEEDLVEAQYERVPSGDREMWTDVFDVEAGPWALHLTGTAVPTPQLAVSVRGNQVAEPSVEPFLTLVRPAEGFEIVHLDSHRNGKIALPHGDSVMLVQGDEVWEVHFSFP
jgi:hypothetical protein